MNRVPLTITQGDSTGARIIRISRRYNIPRKRVIVMAQTFGRAIRSAKAREAKKEET